MGEGTDTTDKDKIKSTTVRFKSNMTKTTKKIVIVE